MLKEYELAGKTAIVTGVSRTNGIGAAIAKMLAACGANIVMTYYRSADIDMGYTDRQEDASIILEDIRAQGVRAYGLEADLSDVSVPAMIFDCAEREIGPVDILVNNATLDITPTDIYSLTPETFDRHYAVNLRGATLLCAEFARRHDGTRPGGRIINLTSGQCLHPMPNNLPYAVTKAAIECLTTCLSVTLGPKNITVNAVDPGATDTGWITEELKAIFGHNTLGNQVGMPEDAARLIAFLASEQARWITGQILHSRGGA